MTNICFSCVFKTYEKIIKGTKILADINRMKYTDTDQTGKSDTHNKEHEKKNTHKATKVNEHLGLH